MCGSRISYIRRSTHERLIDSRRCPVPSRRFMERWIERQVAQPTIQSLTAPLRIRAHGPIPGFCRCTSVKRHIIIAANAIYAEASSFVDCGVSLNDRRTCIRLSGFKGSHEAVNILCWCWSSICYFHYNVQARRDGVITMPLTPGERRAVPKFLGSAKAAVEDDLRLMN